jgi:TDG/mug DNA glycosylase family protein
MPAARRPRDLRVVHAATPTDATPPPPKRGLAPVLGPETRCLILGSFPSEASLAAEAYYAHPRNLCWRLLATALSHAPASVVSAPYPVRIAWLRAAGVGLWDVYASCSRVGSLDSAITDATPNDLASLAALAPHLALIAHNGGESWRHARLTRTLGVPVVRLPSSSPAAAGVPWAQKLAAWREALAAAGLPVVS